MENPLIDFLVEDSIYSGSESEAAEIAANSGAFDDFSCDCLGNYS